MILNTSSSFKSDSENKNGVAGLARSGHWGGASVRTVAASGRNPAGETVFPCVAPVCAFPRGSDFYRLLRNNCHTNVTGPCS